MVFRRVNGPVALGQLRSEMDRLFDDFFGPASALQRAVVANRTFPAMNLWEEGESLVAEAEVPGLKHEDLDISVVGNELTVKGKRLAQEGEGVCFHRRERGVGEFVRSIKLPVEVAGDKVEATLQDGVLRIMLPKAEAAKPRKIQVKAG